MTEQALAHAGLQEPRRRRAFDWLKTHRLSLIIAAPLLALVSLVQIINLPGFPAPVNDDEGTYVSQAWAVLNLQELAHYTYWYDHPPIGWIQIAGYAWLTRGFQRADVAIMMGREFMALTTIVSSALIYLIARRLQLHRLTAVVAVGLFAFSPLALYYHRMVFLDNIATMWTLGAIAFALSPRRSLSAAFGSAACLTVAIMSKETAGVLLPVVVWILIQNSTRANRPWVFGVFGTLLAAMVSFYPLFALLKGELLPGKGHVSLAWALQYQFFGREGSGSLFDPGSDTHRLVFAWFNHDSWLLWAGLGATIPALFVRKLRPFALAMVIMVAIVFKGGYLPTPYIIAVLPFAVLVTAGVGDELCQRRPFTFAARRKLLRGVKFGLNRTGIAAVLAAVIAFGVLGAPQWQHDLHKSTTQDDAKPYRDMLAWVKQNIPPDATLAVDDNLWPDLTRAGYSNAIWFFKVDLDPAVKKEYVSQGYTGLDYVILDRIPDRLLRQLPTVYQATVHSARVRQFENREVGYTVYRVNHGAT